MNNFLTQGSNPGFFKYIKMEEEYRYILFIVDVNSTVKGGIVDLTQKFAQKVEKQHGALGYWL